MTQSSGTQVISTSLDESVRAFVPHLLPPVGFARKHACFADPNRQAELAPARRLLRVPPPQTDAGHGLLAPGRLTRISSRRITCRDDGEGASRHVVHGYASRDCVDFVVWPSCPMRPAEGASVVSNVWAMQDQRA